jgi:penicillin-binding protein 1A
LTPGEAYEVTQLLEQVITSGTGTPASIGCSTGSAGKTGTSEELSDAWFVGYTPKFSTAVWTGHPNSREYTGYGGPTSGPIWQQYMKTATAGVCTPFAVPTNLPSLSTYTSDHTVSPVSPHVKPYPTSPGPTPDTSPGQNGSGKYPGQFYAPGAGQGPAPSPAPGGGNPGGGNPGGDNSGGGGGGGTGGTG